MKSVPLWSSLQLETFRSLSLIPFSFLTSSPSPPTHTPSTFLALPSFSSFLFLTEKWEDTVLEVRRLRAQCQFPAPWLGDKSLNPQNEVNKPFSHLVCWRGGGAS